MWLGTDVGLAPLIDVFANPAMRRITTRGRLGMTFAVFRGQESLPKGMRG